MASTHVIKYIFKAIDNYSRVAKIVQRQTKKVRKSLERFAKTAQKVGRTMSRNVTLPILAVGAASIFAFSNMEKGLQNVFTLLTKPELVKFGAQLEAAQIAAVKMGFSIQDSSKALFDNVSALGASEKSLEAFDAAQKLAIAGVTDLTVSVDGITSIVNAYGRETTDATEVANAFFSAQVKGKTTVEELATTIGRVAPIAKQAGVGFKELLATTSALTLGGLSTDIATTALRGTLSALVKPTKEAQKVLKKLGVPFGTTAIRAAGLAKTLQLLNIASEKYPDLLAQAIPNIRAFTGVTALSADKLVIIEETLTKINNDYRDGTGLNEAYTRQQLTLNRALKRMGGSLTIVGNQLGAVMAPTLIKVASALGKFSAWFEKLGPGTKKFIVIFGLIIATLGPLILILGQLAFAVSHLIPVFGALNIMMAANPAGLIALGIMAMVIAMSFLIKNWEKIWSFVKDKPFFKFIGNQFERAKKVIDIVMSSLKIFFDQMSRMKNFVGGIKGFFGFGGGGDQQKGGIADVAAPASKVDVNNKLDQNINIVAPQGTTATVDSKGNNLKVGLNMPQVAS